MLSPPSNKAEAEFVRRIQVNGVELHRCGWPDFWWLDAEGYFCVAEVKPAGWIPLEIHQFTLLSALFEAQKSRAESGISIRIYTWTPHQGLREFNPGDWVERKDVARPGYYLNTEDAPRIRQPPLTVNQLRWRRIHLEEGL